MTQKSKFLWAAAAILLTSVSWQNKPAAKLNVTAQSNKIPATTNSNSLLKWDYVFDARYSRTCATGGGVCWISVGEGDLWWDTYLSVIPPGDVPGDDGTDPEYGPMYLRVEDNKLHAIFCRSVEGSKVQVERDVQLRDALQESLGKKFTIRRGDYAVDFSNYNEFGEAWLDIY